MLQIQQKLTTWIWYEFTQRNLAGVPVAAGVYCLGVGNQIIYIGSSSNLNERLTDHYYSDDQCIRRATQFAIEPRLDYKLKERQLLQWYQSTYGRLPDCNDRI
jgi:hypothetical protein